MSLNLRYHAKSSVPVEIEGVIPDSVRAKSLTQIEKVEIQHGNEKL
jgi:formylmethanofuran dehydrogenase subunit C